MPNARADTSSTTSPTGTVTFLFTDIEGSTRLWESQQAAMEVALPRHDALVRQCIADHGGHVFKTGGDAFCAAFHTASATASGTSSTAVSSGTSFTPVAAAASRATP